MKSPPNNQFLAVRSLRLSLFISACLVAIDCFPCISYGQPQIRLTASQEWYRAQREFEVFSTIMSDDDLKKELKIKSSQLEEIKKLQEEFKKSLQLIIAESNAANEKVDANPDLLETEVAKMKKQIMDIRDAKLMQKGNILLELARGKLTPAQSKRIAQLSAQSFWVTLRRKTGFELIEHLVEGLRLPQAEFGKIKESIKELDSEYQSELKKLKDRYTAEMLKELPPGAAEKMKDLLGDFKYGDKKR